MALLGKQLILLICISIGTFIASVVCCYFYPKLAFKYGAIATPNFRSLHSKVMPRGAGIVIAMCMLLAVLVLSTIKVIDFYSYFPILIGGLVVSTVGFIDDCFELSARFRLLMQFIVAIWIYFWFANGNDLNVGFMSINLGLFKFPITIFLLVWFYNWFNFIDGSDGMASSAVVYTSMIFSVIYFVEHQQMLLLLLMLLGSATVGFMVFNWPPAKVFLGDAGTSFCSYIISIVMVLSIWQNGFNIWVWVIALGYYITDTTITTLIRIIKLPKKWYQPHRSHAYQNLAHTIGHLKILLLVWGFNLLWFLPLAVSAYVFPKYSMLFFVVAYAAIVPFVLKYGPLYKKD